MLTDSQNSPSNDEITLRELIISVQRWWRYLLSHWKIIGIACLFGGGMGLGFSFWKQPMYTATTTLVLESGVESGGGLSRLTGLAAAVGLNFGGEGNGLFQGANIYELYKSRTMLAQTLLEELHPDSNELLIERYMRFNRIKEKWRDRPELLALDFRVDPATLDSETRRIYEGVITSFTNDIRLNLLTVDKVEKNLSIVRVDVVSPDEVFSKAFNEYLVKNVNEFYIETKTKKYAENIAIMEKKVDSVHAVMTGAIYSAAKVSDATPNLNPTRQVQRIAPAQEAQFSAEANKAILSQLVQNLELTKMALLQEQPLIQLIDRPVYPLPEQKIGKVFAIIIGAFSFGFIAALLLIVKKVYRDVMGVHSSGPELANT